jgi:AAA domain
VDKLILPAGSPVKREIAIFDIMADPVDRGKLPIPLIADTEIAPQGDGYDPDFAAFLAEHDLANDTEYDYHAYLAADDPGYQAYLVEHRLPTSGRAYEAWCAVECAREEAEEAATRKAKRLADGEWWADGQAFVDAMTGGGASYMDYMQAAVTAGTAPADGWEPQEINGATLDNQDVPGEWVTYAGALEDDADDVLEEIIPLWSEKSILTLDEGPGGVGKSYINQQDAACIAAGHSVLGEPVVQTDVLYLNYEEPEKEFKRRMTAIRRGFGMTALPDGRTRREWYQGADRLARWPAEQAVFTPLDTSRFYVRHLREHAGAHILRVTDKGKIILTRYGHAFLDRLAQRRDQGLHSYVVLDGMMDALLFEGGTRMDDSLVRQVLSLIDRWCIEYNMTCRGILHPSRAAERQGGGSYAPAWSTKPRAVQTYKRVTADGSAVLEGTAPELIHTRRKIEKRSHGQPGHSVIMKYSNGIWGPVDQNGGGGEEAVTVAVELACRYDDMDQRIKRDGTLGKDGPKLTNQHQIIAEYRRRTGRKYGRNHFLGTLGVAAQEGKIAYQDGKGHTLAGYVAVAP